MTSAEITAKEIGEHLTGALAELRKAKRLINERDHSIAWGNVFTAINKTEQAIAMMRQDYRNLGQCVDGCNHNQIDHFVARNPLTEYCNSPDCECSSHSRRLIAFLEGE